MTIDIISSMENEPPELNFILPGFLSGTVGALIATGSTGKSFFSLELAISIANPDVNLLEIQPMQQGKVLLIAAEDPPNAIIHRLHNLGKYISCKNREIIAQNLRIEAIIGKRLDITNEKTLARIIEAATGYRLIIFDTLSRCHRLDENSNSDMAFIISTLEHIADKTKSAILFLHHISKQSAFLGQGTSQHAARGASSLVDNARWVGNLTKMSENEAKKFGINDHRSEYLKFSISKINYTSLPPEKWFKRSTGGILTPVSFNNIEDKNGKKRKKV